MSGYSEDIECPHCGWEGAQYNHESRGEYRGETRQCLICGWDEYSWADLWDEEDEDAPEEYEEVPDEEIITYAKIMVPFVEFNLEDSEFENPYIQGLIPQLLERENWHKLIDFIFGNFSIIIENEEE